MRIDHDCEGGGGGLVSSVADCCSVCEMLFVGDYSVAYFKWLLVSMYYELNAINTLSGVLVCW